MKKLRYSLSNEGKIDAISYVNKNLDFEVDENIPFQSIGESLNWRKVNGVWEEYDSDWTHEEYDTQLTISESNIIDIDDFTELIKHVKGLIKSGRAKMEKVNGNRIMYFESILPLHKKILDDNGNHKLKTKQ